jgi:electron transport complex protein RnfG
LIIEQRQAEEQQQALVMLFPDANEFEEVFNIVSADPMVTFISAFSAKRNGQVIGAALNLSRPGYSGNIRMMVGVNADQRITGVRIMEHTETPGLGANAASSRYFVNRAEGITFYGQFVNKNVNDHFVVRRDVDVIAASTITSVAVADSVKAAGLAVTAWIQGGAR